MITKARKLMTNSDWELKIAENMGELVGTYDSQDVVVPGKTSTSISESAFTKKADRC